jgi:hypothetical protein
MELIENTQSRKIVIDDTGRIAYTMRRYDRDT